MIRYELGPEEHIDWNCISFRQLILGDCHGVALNPRGPSDPHVMITVLTEDDGQWIVSNNGTSSFWLPNMIEVLQNTQKWIEENCEPDIPTNETWPKDKPCGWRFKGD